jgi:esterase/lipase superfamily enzyme
MADRAIELEGGRVLCYGHWGRPVIAFPSERGEPWDWEDRGLVDELGPLFAAGRLKLYCISSYDAQSWQSGVDLEEAARRHGFYEWWVTERVVPFVHDDAKTHEILVAGASFGAYHAANFCLKRGDLFPLAICMSGVYDVTVAGGGHRGDAVYFNNPMDYVQHLHGGHLDWLRSRVNIVLVCGQGQWEDTTGALESTKRFGWLLGEKGIRHEVDLWGHDVPHDWPSWRRQIAHHLPRFV